MNSFSDNEYRAINLYSKLHTSGTDIAGVARKTPDALSDFIDEVESSEKTLLLLNRNEPTTMVELLSQAFENQPVTVAERHIPEGVEDLVCLVDDGEVIATSPFWALEQSFLMVNVDRYRTGTRQSEIGNFPSVLTGLAEVEFTVRGFPQSNKEKLLLVLISRFIEHRALQAGAGTFHATFQKLSRLDDEYGTKNIYQYLADSAVETHVYGVRDDPTVVHDLDATVHGGESQEYRRSWVVLYRPPTGTTDDSATEGPVALVAVEIDPNVWRGMWTYDATRVTQIQAYLEKSF